MLLPELQRLAGELGIPGTGKMRKSDLVAAISERQGGAPGPHGPARGPAPPPPPGPPPAGRRRRGASRPAGAPTAEAASPAEAATGTPVEAGSSTEAAP